MNKLKTMLCAVFTLCLVNTAHADSSNFAGPYVGLSLIGAGVELDGESRSSAGTSAAVEDEVQAGAALAVAGWEVGYALPVGATLLLDVGANFLSGEAKVDHNTDAVGAAGNVSFTISDVVTAYIAPTIALSDTSSIYVKFGISEAGTGVTGDIRTPADLKGETFAIGTRTVLESGIFIRTEAGMTDYNGISTAGKGEGTVALDLIDTNTTYAVDPTVAYGQVSLGMRF